MVGMMSGDRTVYQEKNKKITLIQELQQKIAKEEGLSSYSQIQQGYETKTQKGYSFSRKLQGLELFKQRVKAQGAVVTADMITPEMKSEYQRDYQLSSKELERMLSEMQQGYVEDFHQEENEYGRFKTNIKSEYSKEKNAGESKLYSHLGEVLYEKRKTQNLPSFQLVTLEKNIADEFKAKHHLSEKKLQKISLDIQTHAITVPKYKTVTTIDEDLQRLQKESAKKVEEEIKQQEKIEKMTEEILENKETKETFQEQELREIGDKKRARLSYLQTGTLLDKTPKEWPMGEYVNAAQRYLSQVKGDPLEMETLVPLVKDMEQNLKNHREAIEQILKEEISEYEKAGLPSFLAEKIKKGIRSDFEKENIMFFFENKTEFYPQIHRVFKTKEEELQKLLERGKQIQSEIGKNRINLSLIKNQKLEELYTLPGEEFEAKLEVLAKQVQFSLTHVDQILYEEFTPIERERVFDRIQEQYGEILILGTPRQVYDMINHFMEKLPQELGEMNEKAEKAISSFAGKIMETVNDYLGTVEELYMPQSAWKKLLTKAVSPKDSLEEMKKKLEDLATRVVQNIAKFRKDFKGEILPITVWNKLYEYRDTIVDENIGKFPKMIQKKLKEELLKEYEITEGSYDFSKEYCVNLEQHFFALTAVEEKGVNIREKENFVNVERLKGPELLKHPEFEYAFRYNGNMFLRVLDQVLQEGGLKLECLKGVNRYEELDNLSYGEMEMVLSLLRTNLRGVATRWGNIIGEIAFDVKETLLTEMIKGEVSKEKIEERIEKEINNQKKEYPLIRKLRARFFLSTEETLIRTNTSMIKVKENSYFAKYKNKFEDANRAWELLRANGLEEKAVKACWEYISNTNNKYFAQNYDAQKWAENPAKPLKKLIGGLKTREAKVLEDKLSRGREGNFINEFLLCRYGNLVLRQDINPTLHKLLTGPVAADGNDAAILHRAGIYSFSAMDWVTKTIKELSLPKEEEKRYLEKMIPLSLGFFDEYSNGKKIEDGDIAWARYQVAQEKIIKRTGVEDAKKLCDEIILNVKGKQETQLKRQKERYQFLRKYENGILVPILPNLLQDDTFWISMATMDLEEFQKKLDKLTASIRLPLEILKSRFSGLGKDLYDEVCDRFAREIMYGEEKDKVSWLESFDKFFREYSEDKLGKFSITKLVEERREKNDNDPVIPYITEILLNHKEGLALAAEPKKLHKLLDDYGKNIGSNLILVEKAIHSYLSNHKEEFEKNSADDKTIKNQEEIFRKGCLMYLQSNIIYKPVDSFAANLEKWIAQYLKLRSDMMADTEEVKERMEERRRKLEEVQNAWDTGMQRQVKDLETMQRLKKDLHRTRSPFQMVMGGKKQATEKEIQRAKSTVEENWKDFPRAVKNCLIERKVSGADQRTILREATWLKQAYDLAENMVEQLPAEEKKHIVDREKILWELLMYTYLERVKEKEYNFDLNPDLSMLQKDFENLKGRHQSMAGLQEVSYVWSEQYQPVFWELNQDVHTKTEREENPVLAPYRHLVMEAMAVGMYTMKQEEFEGIIKGQTRFLRNAELADKIFEKIVKKYVDNRSIEKNNEIPLRDALVNYFRADLMEQESVDTMKLQEQVDRLLMDQDYLGSLLKGKLVDSAEQDSIWEEERTLSQRVGQQAFEDFLGQNRNLTYRIEYNMLTGMQRQVFALWLLLEKEERRLPGMEFVCSEELVNSRCIMVNRQLQDYVENKAFNPVISYQEVLEHLQDVKGNLNKELFYEAMEATKEYTKQRQKNRPKDYRRLKDASYSLQEAKGLLNQQVESEDFELTTTDKLKQWILQQDKEWEKEGRKIEEQKKKIMTLKEEIKSFTDFQWNLLTMALNDRTMLDYTTDLAAGENSNIYVNEDKRSRFKEYDVKNPIIKLEQINNAAKTLLSYQLRDDGVLSYGHLTKKDFAPEALERSTKVDWDLLKRAISLVKEVS